MAAFLITGADNLRANADYTQRQIVDYKKQQLFVMLLSVIMEGLDSLVGRVVAGGYGAHKFSTLFFSCYRNRFVYHGHRESAGHLHSHMCLNDHWCNTGK